MSILNLFRKIKTKIMLIAMKNRTNQNKAIMIVLHFH